MVYRSVTWRYSTRDVKVIKYSSKRDNKVKLLKIKIIHDAMVYQMTSANRKFEVFTNYILLQLSSFGNENLRHTDNLTN